MRKQRHPRDWFIRGSALGIEPTPSIDFQTHTRWTDGRSSIAELIAAAETKGLNAIGITEHVNSESAWYPRFVEEVKTERRPSAVEVYFGAEIAAADYAGGLKANPCIIQTELLLGVVHRLPKQDGSGFWRFDELKAEDAIELEIRALHGLTSNPRIDILGHPGGTTFSRFGPFPVEWLEPIFCAARDYDVAVELNSKYLWDFEGILELLRRVDPLVSFGSDAHDAHEVGFNLSLFPGTARNKAPALAP